MKKRKRPHVTPGPYEVRENYGFGYYVLGVEGIAIAWCSTAGVHSARVSHRIDLDEARANAEFLCEALRARKKQQKKYLKVQRQKD